MVARWLRRWLPFALIAWGQASLATNVPGTDNIHFRTFGPAQGMSHSTVLAMAQDTTGFFWVGTQDGLNRFDGSEFRVYKADRDDPWSLPQNYVLALASDSDGSLWVGTRNSGLSRYDPLLDRFEGVSREGAGSGEGVSDRISALLLDKDRRLWVTNASGQVLWLDRVANHLIPAPVPVIDALRAVRSMMQSQDGRVWFGTREGLWRVDADGRGLRELRASPSTALNVFALAQTPDGRIWVGTNADGLYAMDQDGAQIQHYVARSPWMERPCTIRRCERCLQMRMGPCGSQVRTMVWRGSTRRPSPFPITSTILPAKPRSPQTGWLPCCTGVTTFCSWDPGPMASRYTIRGRARLRVLRVLPEIPKLCLRVRLARFSAMPMEPFGRGCWKAAAWSMWTRTRESLPATGTTLRVTIRFRMILSST